MKLLKVLASNILLITIVVSCQNHVPDRGMVLASATNEEIEVSTSSQVEEQYIFSEEEREPSATSQENDYGADGLDDMGINQEPQTIKEKIYLYVVDRNSSKVSNALVSFDIPELDLPYEITTDANGLAVLNDAPVRLFFSLGEYCYTVIKKLPNSNYEYSSSIHILADTESLSITLPEFVDIDPTQYSILLRLQDEKGEPYSNRYVSISPNLDAYPAGVDVTEYKGYSDFTGEIYLDNLYDGNYTLSIYESERGRKITSVLFSYVKNYDETLTIITVPK